VVYPTVSQNGSVAVVTSKFNPDGNTQGNTELRKPDNFDKDQGGDLIIVDLVLGKITGSFKTKMTNEKPAISANGRVLAFYAKEPDGRVFINIYKSTGELVRKIENNGQQVNFTPDGKYILFGEAGKGWETVKLD
jgi:Tol biopolymer transport system component